jgi:hypothetical protein
MMAAAGEGDSLRSTRVDVEMERPADRRFQGRIVMARLKL